MPMAHLKVPPAERMLIDAVPPVKRRVHAALTTSLGRGQISAAIRSAFPNARVLCHFLDLYPASETKRIFQEENIEVDVVCTPDLSEGPFDLAVLPLSKGGESELARDLLQQAYDRLAIGGLLLVSVDQPKETWMHHELEKLSKHFSREPGRHGVVYRMIKKAPLKRMREFSCEFAFRDGKRLVRAVSRPGVFSHRKLDLGARAVLESMVIVPGINVLDIGCGSGVIGLAAALRDQQTNVVAIDSNARAVDCSERGKRLNDISDRLTVCLTATGDIPRAGEYDLAIGNPPYYSHYTIAELFLQTARRALRIGGEVMMVTRQPEWFLARMEQLFTNVQCRTVRGYAIATAVQQSHK